MFAAALAELVAVAQAEDDGARAALAHAVQRYLSGDAAGARTELQALLANNTKLDADVRRDAMFWLGDLLYADGGAIGARNAFETLLADAPDYQADTFAHAPEVVAYFESLRAELSARRTPEPPDLPEPAHPWPWRHLIPAGVGYFVDGKPAAGALVGGLQLVGLGVSIGTYAELTSTYRARDGSFPQDDEEGYKRFKRLEAVNRGFATLGVLAWLVPIPIETTRWAVSKPVAVSIGPGTVTFRGTF